MSGLSTSEAGNQNWQCLAKRTEFGFWELERKTDPRSGEDFLVAANSKNVFFREDVITRALLSAL